MHLIDDQIAPGGRRAPRRGPRLLALDDRFRDEGGAVGVVLCYAMNTLIKQRRVQLERAIELRRIGVDEQLRDVETQPSRGLEWPVRAKTVTRADADPGDMPMEDVAGASRQADAGGLAVGLVEQRQVDRFGAAGGDGDVDAAVAQANAERVWLARADAVGLCRRRAQVITDGAARPVKCSIPASSFDSATRSPRADAVSTFCRAGSGSKRSI
jgi:hypothetical protein